MGKSASNILVARYSREKLALQLILFSLLVAVSGWLSLQPAPSVGYVACVLMTPLFAFLWVVTVRRLLNREPVLILDDDGIVARVRWTDVGRIPWSEITGARAERVNISRRVRPLYLIISVRDPTRFIQGSWLRRYSRRAAVRRYGSPVAIPAMLIDADVDRIAEEVRGRVGPPVDSPSPNLSP